MANKVKVTAGMDYWWERFCESEGFDAEADLNEATVPFAQWFAHQCCEAGDSYFGKRPMAPPEEMKEITDPKCIICGKPRSDDRHSGEGGWAAQMIPDWHRFELVRD